jgi:hypothetical protein
MRRAGAIHHCFRIQRRGGGGAEPGGTAAYLKAGDRAVQRLALLPGEQVSEPFSGAFHGVGGPQERGGPRLVPQRGPRRLCRSGAFDGNFEVFKGMRRGFPHGFAGRRVKYRP